MGWSWPNDNPQLIILLWAGLANQFDNGPVIVADPFTAGPACALWIHLPAQVTHLLPYPKLSSPCSRIRFTSLSLPPFSSLSLPHPPKKPSTSVDQTAIPFHSIALPLTLNPNSIFPTPINSFDLNCYHHHPHLLYQPPYKPHTYALYTYAIYINIYSRSIEVNIDPALPSQSPS